MSYLLAFALCLAFTILAVLGGSTDAKWLLISDANVALWLFVAWRLGRRRV